MSWLTRSSVTSPACRSTLRCCETAGRVIAKDAATSCTGRAPPRSRSRMARRTGLAMASKTSASGTGRGHQGGGRLQHDAVPVRVVEGDEPPPRRLLDAVGDVDAPGADRCHVGVEVVAFHDGALG